MTNADKVTMMLALAAMKEAACAIEGLMREAELDPEFAPLAPIVEAARKLWQAGADASDTYRGQKVARAAGAGPS